jgi:hypothetical protein
MAVPLSGSIPDPRSFRPVVAAPAAARAWYALAESSLSAETGVRADEAMMALRNALARAIEDDPPALDDAVAHAPAPATARVLWRELDAACAAANDASGLDATVFALPIVVVAAMQRSDGEAVVPGVLDSIDAIGTVLREGKAIGGSETFALANTLVGARALSIASLPQWLALRRGGMDATSDLFAPVPIRVMGATEGAHLRFLCGRAIHAPGIDLLRDAGVGGWGMPLTRALNAELAAPGLSLLVLPRAPARPLPALQRGLAAQREVGAQLFASNAIRKLRAAVGEPQAVISAHTAEDAPGGGELRLSISSPFEPRDAEGFRCPLHPIERASDVAAMLIELLHDCRVHDVRVVAGVHPDRHAGSRMPLLFKPETIPGGERGLLQ